MASSVGNRRNFSHQKRGYLKHRVYDLWIILVDLKDFLNQLTYFIFMELYELIQMAEVAPSYIIISCSF